MEFLTGFIPMFGGMSDGKDSTPISQDVQQYIIIATSIIGASVCPPNFFLHSALVHTRRFSESFVREVDTTAQLRTSVKYNAIETAFGIFCAFCINAIILIVAGEKYYNADDPESTDSLTDFSNLLKTAVGPASSFIFAFSILAGGQSASVTGTLASQYILEGFMNI